MHFLLSILLGASSVAGVAGMTIPPSKTAVEKSRTSRSLSYGQLTVEESNQRPRSVYMGPSHADSGSRQARAFGYGFQSGQIESPERQNRGVYAAPLADGRGSRPARMSVACAPGVPECMPPSSGYGYGYGQSKKREIVTSQQTRGLFNGGDQVDKKIRQVRTAVVIPPIF